jgi:enoyl-CoA hydratase
VTDDRSDTGQQLVRLTEQDGVWTLLLDDPERRNAISRTLQRQLGEAVSTVAAADDARALVVGGTGSSFCAGADLPAVFGDTSRSVATLRDDLHTVYGSFLRLLDLGIPTIAAVQGPAVGAGLNLAMACDVRYVGPRASLAATFTRIGLHPGGGCTWFLVRALGPQRALALLLDGGSMDAEQAVASGVALSLEEDPLAAAQETARRWAAIDPQLVRDVKTSVRTAQTGGFAASLDFESWAQASSATKPQVQEVVARFRKP